MGVGYVRQDTDNSIETGEIIEAAELDNEFNAVVAAFNATTGHTHDGTSSEGGPISYIGPAQNVVATGVYLRPTDTTGVMDLGSSANRWRNGFFTSTVTAAGFSGPLTGIASSATVLNTARNFSITGGATAAVISFNGSANVPLNVTSIDADFILTGTVPKARLPILQNPTTFQGIPALTAERTTTTINALVEYKTTAGSIFAGQGTEGQFNIGTTSNLNGNGNNVFGITVATGDMQWDGVATGNGSGITNLDATALTGIINNNRLSGAYSFASLNLSGALILNNGTIQGPSRIEVSTGGSTANPNYGFQGTGGPGKGMHVYQDSNSPLMFVYDSTPRLEITAARITAVNGAIFQGNGSLLTDVPAGAISGGVPATSLTGTVPNARLSGSYTGITGTGALNAGSIASGFGSINIGTNTFTGNGSGLTNLDSANLTGTIISARLPTTTGARDWVLARTAETAAHNAIGSYAMLSQISGTAANPGQTKTAAALNYAHAGGVGPGTIAPTAGSVWMCMSDLGGVGSGDASVGLWLRVS